MKLTIFNIGITEDAFAYLQPLIEGTPYITYKDGLPAYIEPYYMRAENR